MFFVGTLGVAACVLLGILRRLFWSVCKTMLLIMRPFFRLGNFTSAIYWPASSLPLAGSVDFAAQAAPPQMVVVLLLLLQVPASYPSLLQGY